MYKRNTSIKLKCIVLLLLTFAIIFGTLSCGIQTINNTENTAPESITSAPETIDAMDERKAVDDALPEMDFEGISFYLQRVIGEQKSKDFESYYAANSAASLKHYNELCEFFDNIK